MPSKKPTGSEPAAPSTSATETFTHVTEQQSGLTKRETAAIAALTGLAANPAYNSDPASHVAARAWELADALFPNGGAA